MISKFMTIRSVGKFKNFDTIGDISFKEFNFIYGDNGSGKTTFEVLM